MRMRKDALTAAAEIVLSLERSCGGGPGAAGPPPTVHGLVCTVGKLSLWPGASNVIAGAVNMTVDIRSGDDVDRLAVIATLEARVAEVCAQRGVQCAVRLVHEAAAVHSDARLMEKLSRAVQGSAQSCPADGACAERPPHLVSGAGHDALAMAELGPMAMMFVRCRGGVSHSPLEHVSDEDVGSAVQTLHAFLLEDLL